MNLMPFQDEPFNGDTFICEEFLKLKDQYKIDVAIETGSCIYTTTKWLCENFTEVLTVEINQSYANFGKHKIEPFENCKAIVGIDSVGFIATIVKNHLEQDPRNCIFFLDAHWGENCPLKDELRAISGLGLKEPPVIAIHDFKTHHEQLLGYDTYKGEALSFDYIYQEIKMLETAYGCCYYHYFNKPETSTGANRGIIYLIPKI